MVEAPLLVRPYLASVGRSDLFVVMAAGMATIAGTVMVLYATFLRDAVPGAIGHLLTASILNAPAAVVIAKLMVPDPAEPADDRVRLGGLYESSMDAITTGTLDGLKLLLNIVAMLIGFGVWLVAIGFLRMMAKADPHISKVYLRQLRYPVYLPARSRPFR